MIWVLAIALALILSLYLVAPFLSQDTTLTVDSEVEAYKAEIRAIEHSEDPDTEKIALLQARLIKAAKTAAPAVGPRSFLAPALISLGIAGSALGIYAVLGSPNFTPEERQAPPPMVAENTQDISSLIPRFEARLAENPNDATGWYLYGRTLMLTGDTVAGLRAYERSLELNDTPEIRREYEAAQTFAAQIQSGPTPEDIAAMQNLSEADRAAAIESMVEGLRARLDAEPNDAQGWARLLRSRKVLGQDTASDIKALREALPDQADAIIASSGITD